MIINVSDHFVYV